MLQVACRALRRLLVAALLHAVRCVRQAVFHDAMMAYLHMPCVSQATLRLVVR